MEISEGTLIVILKYAENAGKCFEDEYEGGKGIQEIIDDHDLPDWYYDIKLKLLGTDNSPLDKHLLKLN